MAVKRTGSALRAPRWQPPSHAAIPHQGEPERTYTSTDARGVVRAMRADANGLLWPMSDEEVRFLDGLGLPTATDWHAPAFGSDEPPQEE